MLVQTHFLVQKKSDFHVTAKNRDNTPQPIALTLLDVTLCCLFKYQRHEPLSCPHFLVMVHHRNYQTPDPTCQVPDPPLQPDALSSVAVAVVYQLLLRPMLRQTVISHITVTARTRISGALALLWDVLLIWHALSVSIHYISSFTPLHRTLPSLHLLLHSLTEGSAAKGRRRAG